MENFAAQAVIAIEIRAYSVNSACPVYAEFAVVPPNAGRFWSAR
jgi:hypothetical protein